MLSLFKLINYVMILYKLKSDLKMTPDLIGKMVLNMAGSQGNRKKQLSQNTATYLQWNC